MERHDFLYPRSRFHGKVAPDRPDVLLFDANLQDFAQRVSYISCLETSGKLSPEAAYSQLQSLWRELQETSASLGIDDTSDST